MVSSVTATARVASKPACTIAQMASAAVEERFSGSARPQHTTGMAKRKKGLQLPAAYEALKKAKAAGADAETLGAAPAPAEAAAEPLVAQLAAGLTGGRGSSGEGEPAQRDALGAGHVGRSDSPEAGGADGPDEPLPEGDGLRNGSSEPPAKAKAGKGAPVLPWMRLPVSIEPGAGVPLESVRGLDVRLLDSLRASAPMPSAAPQCVSLVAQRQA